MSETPHHGHDPIPMRLVEGADRVAAAGDFFWRVRDGKRTLVVALPTSRNIRQWCLSEWTIDHKNHCDASWSWDGREDRPTLSPSIHWVGVWHGHVRQGRLVEC